MFETKEYTLGSGHLHVEARDSATFDPDTFDWEKFFSSEENLLGRIKGGAKFEYSTEKYEDEDDLGYVKISEITKENVKLTSGVMTWNGYTLETLCSTARVTENEDGSQRVKIGGLGNQNDKVYIIGFEHKSKKLRVIIVGKNTEGFSFDFSQDKATVIDTVFTAEAADKEGTLIIIDDRRKKVASEAASTVKTDEEENTGV